MPTTTPPLTILKTPDHYTTISPCQPTIYYLQIYININEVGRQVILNFTLWYNQIIVSTTFRLYFIALIQTDSAHIKIFSKHFCFDNASSLLLRHMLINNDKFHYTKSIHPTVQRPQRRCNILEALSSTKKEYQETTT